MTATYADARYEKVLTGQILDVKSTLFNCGTCSGVLAALSVLQLWQVSAS
jgi:hypothetical protein